MFIHSEPGFHCRTFDTCSWLDEEGKEVMHERAYWPHPMSATNVRIYYWITDYLYTDMKLAMREGRQFDFFPQKGFYCDDKNPHWFPIFDDFEKALAFLRAKTNIDYQPEPEEKYVQATG